MALDFPDVPLFPGVPPVLRRIGARREFERQLEADEGGSAREPVVWGVFDGIGRLAIEPDNVISVEPVLEHRISDYPIEAGGFLSYNKVATPQQIRVVMSKGGGDDVRAAFLARLDELVVSLATYSVVTPDATFLGFNFTRRDYRRTAENGAALIIADIVLTETREAPSAAFTNSKSPSGDEPVNVGPVQTTPATPAQIEAAKGFA